jgi:hypothetical protein
MAESRKPRTNHETPKRRSSSQAPAERLASIDYDKFARSMFDSWGITKKDFAAIQSFEALKSPGKSEMAREIIRNSVFDGSRAPDVRFAAAVAESESLLKGYATLDEPHRGEIKRLIENITAYIRDDTRKRPYNALMLAAPGAGKSHFIKQLASGMAAERVQAVTFNMATMQSADDMAQPIDQLRNLKVNDRFPLLFLDEFDSDVSRYSSLLPLLWDGELHIGHRDLNLGKVVVVLAGSNPDLPKTMERSATMRLDVGVGELAPSGKLVDLLSRINAGVINIPDLDLRTENRDRRVDKVCVAIALLKARFGGAIQRVPRSLLKFVAKTVFRYGVRSIAHLVDVIDSRSLTDGTLKAEKLGLPITSEEALCKSSLSLHLLDKDQGFGIVNRWREMLAADKHIIDLTPAYTRFIGAFRSTLSDG